MFKRCDVTVISNPVCLNTVDALDIEEFQYYDKDGFELSQAEQKFYRSMGYPIDYPILNHVCWQEPWFELETNMLGLILDHSMFLCRCNYDGAALQQLEQLKSTIPTANYLIKTKPKWGYDFSLDAIRDREIFEVLHIEFDHRNFDQFCKHMSIFEQFVYNTDWGDAADKIWKYRDKWQYLTGFDQNHWKSEFLLGWTKSEYTEKSI